MEKLVLFAFFFYLLRATHSLTKDKVLTASFQRAAPDDEIIFSFRGISAPRRHSLRVNQDLLAAEFPNEDRFTVLLDRVDGRVVLESNYGGSIEESSVDAQEVKGKADVQSILVELSQKSKSANIYVNCKLKGTVNLLKVPRDFIQDISQVTVLYDKHAKASIDHDVSILTMLHKMDCPSVFEEGQIQSQSSAVHTYRRGDIPMTSDEKTTLLVQTMSELIDTIKELQIDVQTQREETALLRDALINCEACKPGRGFF